MSKTKSAKNVNIRFVDFYDTRKGEMIEDEPVYIVRDLYSVVKLVKQEPVASVDNSATRLDIFDAIDRYMGVEYTVLN